MKINDSVLIGLLAALAVVLGVVENFIPMPIPALRLGLSNIPVMIMLYLVGTRQAFAVLMLKCFLVPIFSGNFFFKLSLGLPSSLAAFIAMIIIYKLLKKSTTPISAGVCGAFAHMFVQIIIANYLYIHGLLGTRIVGIFLLVSVVTGLLTGILTERIITRSSIKRLFTSEA